jgi:hypothetical protein
MSEITETPAKKKRGRPRKDGLPYMEQTCSFAFRVKKHVLESFLKAYSEEKKLSLEDGKSLFVNNILQGYMEKYIREVEIAQVVRKQVKSRQEAKEITEATVRQLGE